MVSKNLEKNEAEKVVNYMHRKLGFFLGRMTKQKEIRNKNLQIRFSLGHQASTLSLTLTENLPKGHT